MGKLFLIYLDLIALLLINIYVIINWKILVKGQFFFPILQLLMYQFILIALSHILYADKLNNQLTFHLNAILSFFFITQYFKKLLLKTKILTYLQIGFSGLYITYLFVTNGFNKFNSLGFAIYASMVVLMCLLYYLQLFKEPLIVDIYKNVPFRIVTALFVYYTCSFVIFVSYDLLTKQNLKVGYLWRVHNIFILIMVIILITAFNIFKNERKNNIDN